MSLLPTVQYKPYTYYSECRALCSKPLQIYMSDPEPSKHWDLLASDLGVATNAVDRESPSPAPLSPQQATRKASHRRMTKNKERSSKPTANWDLIADELGIVPAASRPGRKPKAAPRRAGRPSIKDWRPLGQSSPRRPAPRNRPITLTSHSTLMNRSICWRPPQSATAEPSQSPHGETHVEKRSRRRRHRRRPGGEGAVKKEVVACR